MKIFNKLLMLIVVAAIAGPFFLKKPDGTPLLNWRDFIPKESVQVITAAKETVIPKQKMYKWKDAKGHWQFGDTPPQGADAVEYQAKAQVHGMKHIELPEDFEDPYDRKPSQSTRFDPTQSSATPFSTAPITEVPKMLDQIKDYQQTLDKRNKALDSL